jgi:hypothetical protein
MPWPTLQNQQYLSLTTFRKSGDPVPTPVWFAEQDGKLYVFTLTTAGKAKRIRNNGSVTVAPCSARGELKGETIPAQARILPAAETANALALLKRKYGWQYYMATLFMRGERVYFEIMPA